MASVLIIDDLANSRYLLRTLLEAEGHQVQEAGDGVEALALARARPPDVAISDVLMPRMDGFALCRAWTADADLRSVPFIVYSATYTDARDEAHALSLGAARFVRKPAEPIELVAAVRAVLARPAGAAAVRDTAAEDTAAGDTAAEDTAAEDTAAGDTAASGASAAAPAADAVDAGASDAAGQPEPDTPAPLASEPLVSWGWPQGAEAADLRLYNRYLVEQLELRLAELQDAYRRLEESWCRFSAIVDSSMDAIMAIGPDGRFASWNRACTEIFGYTAEEAIGQAFTLLVPPELQDLERGRLEAMEEGDRVTFEQRVRRRDGFELEAALTVTRLRGGLGWSVVCRDLTPMRLAERQARAAEGRYQRLAEHMPDIIYRYRLGWDRGFEYVSAAAGSILGLDPEAHYADPDAWERIVHPDDRARLRDLLAGGTEEAVPITLRFRRPDGAQVWVELRSRVLTNTRGEAVAVEGVGRDVSDRVRAEAELTASNARLQRLLSSSPTVVYSLVEEGATLSATWVSDNITRMFGWTVEECLRPGWWVDNVHPDDRDAVLARQDALRRRGELSHSYRIRCKDGGYRWIHDELNRVEGSAAPRRYVGAWRDVTDERAEQEERAALHAQLVQAQKMEALGTLAGGVAHDFNNYLTAILAYAGFVKDELPPGSQAAEDIERVIDGGQRSARLVSQLLAFSRQQVVRPVRVDVNEVVTGITRMLRRMIGEDIQLRSNLAEEIRPVLIDPGQLEQVLMNLAVNARDAMPTGGELRVSTALQEVDEAGAAAHPGLHAGVYVVLEVADTGQGMDEDTRRRAFEPFFTTKGVGRGTGLGLATVYGIVKQADGYIMLDSAPGQGCRFTILLPAMTSTASLDDIDAFDEPQTLHGQETILVVEDDRQVRESTRRMLMAQGYEVLEAANAGEALLICERHEDPIHLLLTDVVMPMMSGVELVERARVLRPEMPVLYMTGYTDDTSVRHGLGGGVPLLRKPFTPAALARQVAAVIGGAGAAPGGEE